MSSGILERLHLIPGARNHRAVTHNHGSHGDLLRVISLARLTQGQLHKVVITGKIHHQLFACITHISNLAKKLQTSNRILHTPDHELMATL